MFIFDLDNVLKFQVMSILRQHSTQGGGGLADQIYPSVFCQAQFQLASLAELSSALILIITPHPPPGKVVLSHF